eukprot:364252-Chlamydomonas_euryale.AAC.3
MGDQEGELTGNKCGKGGSEWKVPALLREAGASRVTFVGGEPFLHPHIDQLLAACKEQVTSKPHALHVACPNIRRPNAIECTARLCLSALCARLESLRRPPAPRAFTCAWLTSQRATLCNTAPHARHSPRSKLSESCTPP